jgi:hypothetical protein
MRGIMGVRSGLGVSFISCEGDLLGWRMAGDFGTVVWWSPINGQIVDDAEPGTGLVLFREDDDG